MAKIEFKSNLGNVLNATEKQLAMAAEIIGGKAESYAKVACPAVTGNLRNSITHTTEDNGHTVVIGTSVEYAPYVELGHHQQPGRYVPAIGKRLVASYVPGKPFLRPAIEENIDEYRAIIKRILSG